MNQSAENVKRIQDMARRMRLQALDMALSILHRDYGSVVWRGASF